MGTGSGRTANLPKRQSSGAASEVWPLGPADWDKQQQAWKERPLQAGKTGDDSSRKAGVLMAWWKLSAGGVYAVATEQQWPTGK